jgi:hypothetical protein
MFHLARHAPYDSIVNIPPVDDSVDPNLVLDDFKNHAVIPHPEFPIAFESTP